MIRLARYLKPFLPLLMLAIALLFVQAVSDLSLPTFLSRIVDVGIQQGGVENAVPRAIRRSTMERLERAMSPADTVTVLGHYTLIPGPSLTSGVEEYIAEYPALARESIYILQDVDAGQTDTLNRIMAGAWLAGSPIPPVPGASSRMVVQAVRNEYQALGIDTGSLQSSMILRIGIWMLLISLLSGVCTVAVGYISARISAGVARDLRRKVFTTVESFSNAEFDTFSTSSLITRSTNDITQIQTTLMILIRMACYAPIMGIGGIIMAVRTSVSMSWIIALAVIVLVGVIVGIFSLTLPKFTIMQKLLDRLNLVTSENLSGIMVIRAFNTEAFEEKRFDRANQDVTDTNLYVNRVMAAMMPVMMLIMNGVSVLIVWVGAHRVAESTMQVGDMMAFMQYALQIVFSFLFLSFMFVILPRAVVSAGRIADVLETEPAIQDPVEPKPFPAPFQGTVEFRNVSFRYPGAEEDVLHDISFVAMPGQTTAFIGSTGSGKSTLINLIPRFYDVTSGAILVGGVDIREVELQELRRRIGYVPQRANLFTGTIESNLRYADENADEATIAMATDTAQATAFIAESAGGMAGAISQGGTNLSGGQRQRLSIARALVRQAPVHIFDDSFSALDFRTDVALRRALRENAGASTILVVAQRISTISAAEQIVVLDEGRIVGKGTHDALMKDCQTYREIALSQLGVEETE